MSAAAAPKGAATAFPVEEQAPPPISTFRWFWEFFRSELEPYPGRLSLVLRMTAAATIAMLCVMAGHLPAGALGGFYTLLISRESLQTTGRQTMLTIVCLGLATLYIILGVVFFVSSPVTHFLWVIVTFFGLFLLIRTAMNYGLAAGCSFVIANSIPLWDRPGNTNVKLALTLYSLYTIAIGALSTLLVESLYRLSKPQDPLLEGLVDRLESAAAVLEAKGRGGPLELAARKKLVQFALTGPSGLRRQLIRSNYTGAVRARVSAVIAAGSRLVELCAAALDEAEACSLTGEQTARLCAAAGAVREQAAALRALPSVASVGASRLPHWDANDAPFPPMPTLPEIEHTIALFGGVLDSFGSAEAQQVRTSEGRLKGARVNALVLDAFTERSHLVFALRGCLAASLCYLIYNGVDWPGISTALTTCFVTALSTVGSSRQKQTLRIAGAITGGFLIALPTQVYILPHLDSITGFTLLFASVTALAAWLATSSPRLSYFGLQIALAFYLVNLQEPFEQTSLAVARDRVVGILLSLGIMGLVFDQIAAPRATERMEELLRQNLLRIGRYGSLVGELTRGSEPSVVSEVRRLRDEINNTFSQMNEQADAVAFEFGPRRANKLRARERMLAMQPPMRSLFLLEIALYEADHLTPGTRRGEDDKPAMRKFLARNEQLLRSVAAAPGDGEPAQLREALPAVEAEAGERGRVAAGLCRRIASSAETLSLRAG